MGIDCGLLYGLKQYIDDLLKNTSDQNEQQTLQYILEDVKRYMRENGCNINN